MIEQVIKWQTDRNLDKMPYSHFDECLNIFEEVGETFNVSRTDASNVLYDYFECHNIKSSQFEMITNEQKVDAYFDICVYAIGAMLKLGYDPMKVFEEGMKEINDRQGSYDAEVGKWCKQPKKENAYKADYNKAKLCNK